MIYRKIFSHYKKGDFYKEGKRERITVMLGVLVLLCVIGCAFMREESLTERLEIGIFGGEQTIQVWTEEQDVWIFCRPDQMKLYGVSEKPLAADAVLYSKYSGISARKRLLVGMIPLAVLGLILTGWMIYTLRQERK